MSPLPGWGVFGRASSDGTSGDTAWVGHHRPVAESTMTDWCEITRPDGEVYDPATGTTTPGAVLVWEGPCRVQAQPDQPRRGVHADALTTSGLYLVAIPAEAEDVREGDLVAVTIAHADPPLADRTSTRPMRVRDVRHGSTLWQRDLTCIDDLD